MILNRYIADVCFKSPLPTAVNYCSSKEKSLIVNIIHHMIPLKKILLHFMKIIFYLFIILTSIEFFSVRHCSWFRDYNKSSEVQGGDYKNKIQVHERCMLRGAPVLVGVFWEGYRREKELGMEMWMGPEISVGRSFSHQSPRYGRYHKEVNDAS